MIFNVAAPQSVEALIFRQYGKSVDKLCKDFNIKRSDLVCRIVDGQAILWKDPFFTYIEFLIKYLRLIKPKKILEWGPGQSTKVMLQECPDAQIICCENEKGWFEKYQTEVGDKVRLIYIDAPNKNRKDIRWNAYTNPAVRGKFDLIFVDGRERVRCLHTAFKRLKPNGVVLLHDANRKRYEEGICLFNQIEKANDTIYLEIGS